MDYGYSFQGYDKEKMARGCGRSLPISTKQSVELCRLIRNRRIQKAKMLLEGICRLEVVVPYKRYVKDLGHKKKIGPGRYPAKAAKEVLKIVEAVEANAQFKGLNTNDLVIVHVKADKASRTWHFGRQRRRQMKRTNIEVVVEERKMKEEEKKGRDTKKKKGKGAGKA